MTSAKDIVAKHGKNACSELESEIEDALKCGDENLALELTSVLQEAEKLISDNNLSRK